MAPDIAHEIKQQRPMPTEEEALLNIWRTAGRLELLINDLLKKFALTLAQYNVLRILRGAGSHGLPCSQLGERMITNDPDITRLLDRMEKNGFVTRTRSRSDRRVVVAYISESALELLGKIDGPLIERIRSTVGKVDVSELLSLIRTLEHVREAADLTISE